MVAIDCGASFTGYNTKHIGTASALICGELSKDTIASNSSRMYIQAFGLLLPQLLLSTSDPQPFYEHEQMILQTSELGDWI
jgi:hypothetical protein